MQLLVIAIVLLQSTVWLPFVTWLGGSPSQPTVINLRVARASQVQASSVCMDALGPAIAAQGGICLLPGNYISLVASNPNSVVVGGRQPNGIDAAWATGGGFDLIAPSRIIADADILEVSVPTTDSSAGPFAAASANYTIITKSHTEDAVTTSQTQPPFRDMAEFQQTLYDMLNEGQIFDVDWPADVEFWDARGLVSFRPSACGVTHAVWVPDFFGGNVLFDRSPFWVIQRGMFEPPALARCMGQFRWVKVAELMAHPAAQNLRDRVNTRRGGNVQPFQWVTSTQGHVYAFWSFATGTLAWYGYRVINATSPTPAVFLYIPNEFLDVNCVTLSGVKTCTITEGQPEQ